MDQDGLEWTKMDRMNHDRPKCTKTIKDGQIWTKMNKNEQKWAKTIIKLMKMDQDIPRYTKIIKAGQ